MGCDLTARGLSMKARSKLKPQARAHAVGILRIHLSSQPPACQERQVLPLVKRLSNSVALSVCFQPPCSAQWWIASGKKLGSQHGPPQPGTSRSSLVLLSLGFLSAPSKGRQMRETEAGPTVALCLVISETLNYEGTQPSLGFQWEETAVICKSNSFWSQLPKIGAQ